MVKAWDDFCKEDSWPVLIQYTLILVQRTRTDFNVDIMKHIERVLLEACVLISYVGYFGQVRFL